MISVVIPVYNGEKYLSGCVESVLNQTEKDLEVILVNDGSTDDSGAVCEALARRDGRVRVIHKANFGAADTRNRGVQEAKGDIIAFVDADDFLAPTYLEYLLSLREKTGCQCVCCDAVWTGEHHLDFTAQEPEEIRILSPQETSLGFLNEDYLKLVAPWGKLFPRDLVLRNPFPTGRKAEDEATLYKLFYEGGGGALSNRKLYGYYQNPDGLMHHLDEKHYRDTALTHRERYLYFEEKGETVVAANMKACYVNFLISRAALGEALGKDGLKALSAREILSLPVRPLYKINYLCWLLFHRDFLAWLDASRKG